MFKDETGKIYGCLTVIEKSDKTDSSKSIYWKCKCSCGNITIAPGYKLRNGTRVSCGCLRKKKLSQIAKRNIIDETNNVYGRLTVIKLDHIDDKSNRYWKCLCECGNYTIVRGSELRNGQTQSCGCLSSKGEYQIIQFLVKHKINFETQKTFDKCRFNDSNALAKFDFYFPEYNLIIEYDGIQHFEIGSWNTEEKLLKTQEHDLFKNKFCEENNIRLIRISYKDDLNAKLKEIFNIT